MGGVLSGVLPTGVRGTEESWSEPVNGMPVQPPSIYTSARLATTLTNSFKFRYPRLGIKALHSPYPLRPDFIWDGVSMSPIHRDIIGLTPLR